MGCGSSTPNSTAGKEEDDRKAAEKVVLEKLAEEEDAAVKRAEEQAAAAKRTEEQAAAAKLAEEQAAGAKLAEEEAAAKLAEDEAAAIIALDVKRAEEEKAAEQEYKTKFGVYEDILSRHIPGKDPKEKIILSSMFGKQSPNPGGGFQNRQLVFTSKPAIYYLDMDKKTLNGTIPWHEQDGSLKRSVPEASRDADGKSFKIVAEKDDGKPRVYYFKEIPESKECPTQESIEIWIALIKRHSGLMQNKAGSNA